MPVSAGAVIGLVNPKSPSNVGAVMRAAGCFGADAVFYTGQRYNRAAPFSTDTKGAAHHIPLIGVDDLLADVPSGLQIVCVDLVEGALPLPQFQHPERAFYLFGPEDGTLSQAMVDRADAVVFVPTIGCLNLAATVNVVLYDRAAKLSAQSTAAGAHNALIRQSRDANNRVKVKQVT